MKSGQIREKAANGVIGGYPAKAQNAKENQKAQRKNAEHFSNTNKTEKSSRSAKSGQIRAEAANVVIGEHPAKTQNERGNKKTQRKNAEHSKNTKQTERFLLPV